MKHLSLAGCFILFLTVACQNAIKDEPVADTEIPNQNLIAKDPQQYTITKNTRVKELNDVFGYWVGWFLPDEPTDETQIGDAVDWYWNHENKITLSIDTVRNDSVIGHSIVAGNFRPFRGTFSNNERGFSFSAIEPGDDPYDGAFTFSIDLNSDTLKGDWHAFKKIQTPKRIYALTKKFYTYNPNHPLNTGFVDWLKMKTVKQVYDGEMYEMETYFSTTSAISEINPSVDKLVDKQVSKLTKADIYVLRNSIYAKHGYSFKKRPLRVYFDSHDWYMPVHVNIKSDLTDIEKQNIKLLLRYEKYAEEYYDEFGR